MHGRSAALTTGWQTAFASHPTCWRDVPVVAACSLACVAGRMLAIGKHSAMMAHMDISCYHELTLQSQSNSHASMALNRWKWHPSHPAIDCILND